MLSQTQMQLAERRDWFSSGPLSRLGPLYSWGASSPSPPGEGTRSWLFCPLMSLGLWALEARHAVPAYSTGPRAPVPDPQAQSWTAHAGDVIHTFADHFLVSPATTLWLSRSAAQRLGVPQEITWRLPSRRHSPLPTSRQCWKYGSLPRLVRSEAMPNTFHSHFHFPQQPVPLPNGSPRPRSIPFLASLREVPAASSRSPFAAQHSAPPLRGAVVSNPFVTTTAPVEVRGHVRNRPSPLTILGDVDCSRTFQPHWTTERPFGRPHCMKCLAPH